MGTSVTIAVLANRRITHSSIRACFGAPAVVLMSVIVQHLGVPSPAKWQHVLSVSVRRPR